MKKYFTFALIATISMFTTAVMARPRECGPGCRLCPPPPPCRPCSPIWRGYGWNCNRDLGNAAAITSIVANGISIIGSVTTSAARSYAVPVYTQPVCIPTPVAVPTGPLPPGLIVGPGCHAVRYVGGCVCY